MPQYMFGVGNLALIPSGSNPTPVPFAVLTDVSIDVAYDLKELYGSYQFPVAIAKGKGKVTGKAKLNGMLSSLLGAVMPNPSIATGSVQGATGETATIPATPYQVTVTNSATFSVDLGVLDLTAGKTMTRVASSPATLQYSVAAGVYTFAAADTTHNLAISYAYTATGGKTTTVSNQLMGTTSTYVLHAYNQFDNGGTTKYQGVKFYAVHVPKLGFGFKSENYMDVDIDFSAVQDGTTLKVADFYTFE